METNPLHSPIRCARLGERGGDRLANGYKFWSMSPIMNGAGACVPGYRPGNVGEAVVAVTTAITNAITEYGLFRQFFG